MHVISCILQQYMQYQVWQHKVTDVQISQTNFKEDTNQQKTGTITDFLINRLCRQSKRFVLCTHHNPCELVNKIKML